MNTDSMVPRIVTPLMALFLLVACDRQQEAATTESAADSAPRRTRSGRPSRDIHGTRDKLRAALEAAKLQPSGDERDQALAGIAWQALESAPGLAAEALAELPPGFEGKQALIEAYVRMLLEKETADRAMAWADTLYDAQERAFARGTVAALLAESAPEQAAVLLDSSSFRADGVDPAAEQVLQSWMAKNPAEAAAWTTRLPAGEARTAGYKVVFSQWLNTDAPSALAWIASLPNAQVHREAVRGMAEALSGIPAFIRDSQLQSAAPELRAEIEQEIAGMIGQSQDGEARPEE